jgi:GntR family transcriptional repressor for pyruvate dehydrogenase complex
MTATKQKPIEKFQKIEVKKPAEQIIDQIKLQISAGALKPGDRLPSERAFADKFGVGRGHIREAIKKLEFYGILKTLPQSGTFVAGIGVKALDGLISNMLDLKKEDLKSLLEIRRILEANAARLAAERATKSDVIQLIKVHEAFRRKIKENGPNLSEDHLFHIKIAEFSKNPVLRSLIALITPETISITDNRNTDPESRADAALEEHESILQSIKKKAPDQAATAMEHHLKVNLTVSD